MIRIVTLVNGIRMSWISTMNFPLPFNKVVCIQYKNHSNYQKYY